MRKILAQAGAIDKNLAKKDGALKLPQSAPAIRNA
jgi:hypothetical protein